MAPSAEAESVAILYFWDFCLGIFQFLHNNFLREWSQVLEIGSFERGDQGDVDRIQVYLVCSMGSAGEIVNSGKYETFGHFL